MRRRFFVKKFEGGRAELRGEAAEHLGRVLRAEPGQLYELSDGQALWLGRVERVSRDAVEFALMEPLVAQESGLRVTLLLSIVKFDRFEWCLEKATELGVSEIVPLAAGRSEKRLAEAAGKRAARWEKILVESAQQARRVSPPSLRSMIGAEDAFDTAKEKSNSLVLLSERKEARRLREVVGGIPRSARNDNLKIAVAIGPEGGWTDQEFAAARGAGFEEASLGANILRTETAVIAALAVVNYALDDVEEKN